MGRIVLHAGMPKTGSTTLQAWLRTYSELLASRGQHVVTDVSDPDGSNLRFVPARQEPIVNANRFLLHLVVAKHQGVDDAQLAGLCQTFGAALDAAAHELGSVVVSSEGFAALFSEGDRTFLDVLDAVGSHHDLTVVYYVRPQDTALEARWREWGFRGGSSPSQWVAEESRQLRYLETYRTVTSVARAFRFDVRPYRADLLRRGSTVVDFANRYLGLDDPPPVRDQNAGMPTDLVNILHLAPAGLLDPPSNPDGSGWRQGELASIVQGWHVPESEAVRTARAALCQYAICEFQTSNRELVHALGWPTEDLIEAEPARGLAGARPDELLAELDRLWRPQASDAVLGYLFAALGELWR